MIQVWISAAGLCVATLIGSALGFFFKDLPHRWNDTILEFCAGIMLFVMAIALHKLPEGMASDKDNFEWK